MKDKPSVRNTSILLVVLLCIPVGLFFSMLLIDAAAGFAVVGGLILIQWPLMAWLRRSGKLPDASSTAEDC
jgi:hypothetical protein